MRGLIVNADDFGLTPGVNRGICEAHRHGVLTSTSLMVNTDFSAQAAGMSAELPRLSVGLHADLAEVLESSDGRDVPAVAAEELERQMGRFRLLTGRWPVHLDSHHNVHRRHDLLDSFLDVGRRYELRVRDHGAARCVSSFYGQWGGRTHPEQISVEGLEQVLSACEGDPIELACHPGYTDEALRSSYRMEREKELLTLRDRRVPRLLRDLGFELLDSELRSVPR